MQSTKITPNYKSSCIEFFNILFCFSTATAAGVGLAFYLRKKKLLVVNNVHADQGTEKRLPGPKNNLKLQQVQLFFRHGARTPLHFIEGYPQVKFTHDL